MTPFDTLTTTLDRASGVLTVRVSNPPTDLLNATVLADLDRLTRRLSRDRSVRSVVLTGPRDGVFIPHYDLSEIAAGAEELGLTTPYPAARAALTAVAWLGRVPGAKHALAHTPARGLVELLRTTATLDRIGNLPQVVIAAIDGDALGGGCEVALACDVRVMGDGDYRIGLPELTAGIPPGAGGSVRLTRLLGAARASEMILRSITLTLGRPTRSVWSANSSASGRHWLAPNGRQPTSPTGTAPPSWPRSARSGPVRRWSNRRVSWRPPHPRSRGAAAHVLRRGGPGTWPDTMARSELAAIAPSRSGGTA